MHDHMWCAVTYVWFQVLYPSAIQSNSWSLALVTGQPHQLRSGARAFAPLIRGEVLWNMHSTLRPPSHQAKVRLKTKFQSNTVRERTPSHRYTVTCTQPTRLCTTRLYNSVHNPIEAMSVHSHERSQLLRFTVSVRCALPCTAAPPQL